MKQKRPLPAEAASWELKTPTIKTAALLKNKGADKVAFLLDMTNPAFVLDYVDLHREDIAKKYPKFDKFNEKFEISDEDIDQVVAKGIEEGIEKDEESLSFLKDDLKRELKALIARDVYSRNDMYKVLNEDDDAIIKALEVFDNQDKYAALLVTAD